MSRVTCQISMSLDGFVAGPDQSREDPLGRGGERLHEWAFGPGRTAEDATRPARPARLIARGGAQSRASARAMNRRWRSTFVYTVGNRGCPQPSP